MLSTPGRRPTTLAVRLQRWLRSLTGNRLSVRLCWETPGQLTLTCVDNESNSASHQVPVTVTGTPPVIAFDPHYLASALEIGPVLRLIDGFSPGLTAGPGGVSCVLMPQRCDEAVIAARANSQEPQPAVPAAAAVAVAA